MQRECWIIYSKESEKNNGYKWFENEALKVGIKTQLFFDNQLIVMSIDGKVAIVSSQHKSLSLPKYCLMRCYNQNLHFALENAGVRVVNSFNGMFTSQNKLSTFRILHTLKIPSPLTIYPINNLSYSELCEKFNDTKFVVKSLKGMKGEGVRLIGSCKEYKEVVKMFNKDILAQKYIENSHGKDIRVWVVNQKAIAATIRDNTPNFCSNIAQGGRYQPIEISKTIAQLAVRSCKAIDIEVAGVDLLFAHSGYMICEINGNAGFRSAAADSNIPLEIFKYISTLP